MADSDRAWRPLTGADLADVSALAARCLAVHGGLPLAADPGFVARRFGPPDATAWTVREGDVETRAHSDDGGGRDGGRLVAVAAVRREHGTRRIALLVDPSPGEGGTLAARVLDAALDRARDRAADPAAGRAAGRTGHRAGAGTGDRTGADVEVETEFVTPAAEELFASRGLRRVFAEDVMRFDLAATAVPRIALPEGVALHAWTADLAARFHTVYAAAFGERPGFPGWSAGQWVAWTAEDDGFRPGASLLATAADGTDVGFVTSADGWIVQVGVPPAQRGRRLGAALVCAALERQRAAGARQVLLDVSVDNPAGELYRRLGFVPLGRRGRYRPA